MPPPLPAHKPDTRLAHALDCADCWSYAKRRPARLIASVDRALASREISNATLHFEHGRLVEVTVGVGAR